MIPVQTDRILTKHVSPPRQSIKLKDENGWHWLDGKLFLPWSILRRSFKSKFCKCVIVSPTNQTSNVLSDNTVVGLRFRRSRVGGQLKSYAAIQSAFTHYNVMIDSAKVVRKKSHIITYFIISNVTKYVCVHPQHWSVNNIIIVVAIDFYGDVYPSKIILYCWIDFLM